MSTASLMIGVAASHVPRGQVMLAGVSGLVAGAISMAAGEYVSVSSQADTERAGLARETKEPATDPASERAEPASIYQARGLDADLAVTVADRLMAYDALGAHAREELGISEMHAVRPVQAALASAATFAVGAAMPLVTVMIAPVSMAFPVVGGTSPIFQALLGSVAARTGGAPAGAWFGAAA